jgi:two-component system response regulator HydG
VDLRRGVRCVVRGNVRELANVIERALALTRRTSPITCEKSARLIRGGSPAASEELLPLEEVERPYIRRVMAATKGNKTLAAQILGVDRRTLYRREAKDTLSRKLS